MTSSSENLLEQTSCVVNAYVHFLEQAENLTDQLIVAARAFDAEKVDRIVTARSEIFKKLQHYANGIDILMGQVRESSTDSSLEQRRQLQFALDRAGERQKSLARGQSECENLLKAGLSRCRSELLEINQRRGLKKAYSGDRPVEHANFLDKKF